LHAPDLSSLDELVTQALRPEIGAVSPLLESKGRVEDGGATLGLLGPVGSLYRGMSIGNPGVAGQAARVRNLSVAGLHGLTLRRETFLNLGGFAEAEFPDVYHELDFSLRLGEQGLRILWTPYATLRYRSAPSHTTTTNTANSQILYDTSDSHAQALQALHRRWGDRMQDPTFNPNLALDQHWPTPAPGPRVAKAYRRP